MIYIAVGLAVLVGIVLLFTWLSKSDNKEEEPMKEVDADCCGAHEVCELDLNKLSEEIVYFEDEDLDKFSTREEGSYGDEEIDEFRDVLYTLRKNEIADWLHSLELRKILIPVELKQETLDLMK